MKKNAGPKRFFPLFFVVGLWLAIAIVPALSLLFRVQLLSGWNTQFSVFSPKSSPNFWEKSAQRLPENIPVLWQAAGEYPVSEKPEAEEDAEYSADFNEPIFAAGMGSLPPSAENPDPNLPQSQVFPGKLEANYLVEELRRLDLLIARFPQNAVLIAARLRLTLGRMANGRIGGEMSDSKFQENQAAGKPSPERSEGKPNYSPEELNQAIALAQRGGKLEPDNGFFDWIKCCFLIYAWRDESAWQALDAVAQKKRFDDHSLNEQNARMQALSAALNRPLLLEEKIGDFFESLSYSQHGRYREVARIISWQSVKAQRAGDHKKSLRLIAGLARASARQRENSKTYIAGLVASAMEAIAWGGATYDARLSRRGSNRISRAQRIASFGTYATQNGRPELAAEASRNSAASAKYQNSISPNISNGVFGASYWVYIFIELLWIAGVLLLLLLPSAFLLPIVLWALGRTARVRGVFRPEDSSAAEIPNWREVWNGALACGGLRAMGTAICGALIVWLSYLSILVGVGQSDLIGKGYADFLSSYNFSNGNFNGTEAVYYLLSSARPPESQWRWVIAFSPLLLGVLHVAWRATDWQKKQNGELVFCARSFFKSIFQGHAFRSPSGARDYLDVTAAFLKIADWFGMLILIACWYWLAIVGDGSDSALWLIPAALSFIVGGLLLWEKIAVWRARPRRRQSLRYSLRLLQRSLAAWLILGSALYFVLLVISVPLRARAEQGVDRVLRLGEVGASLNASPPGTP